MLMLCLRIACIHVFRLGALPEPTLEVVWIARYFFCTLPNERIRLWEKFRFLPSLRWTDVFLPSYMAKRIRICALTVAVLTKSERMPFTTSHRTIPSPCCTNGGKTALTPTILRKLHRTRQTISTDCCVCKRWMKSYYIPFLSLPEPDGIFSSLLTTKNTGHSRL